MYKIIATTDGKFKGVEFELTASPAQITPNLLFTYYHKVSSGKNLVIANSNYVILAEESQ
jgi:hypothetical protein